MGSDYFFLFFKVLIVTVQWKILHCAYVGVMELEKQQSTSRIKGPQQTNGKELTTSVWIRQCGNYGSNIYSYLSVQSYLNRLSIERVDKDHSKTWLGVYNIYKKQKNKQTKP